VLEDRRVTRLGGTRAIPVEARVLAATNRDLEADVAAGRFREDLYYRINVHPVRVPPLRDRLSDLPEIAERLLEGIGARFGMKRKKLAPEALELLMAHDWRRNNVRELRNALERMVIAADGELLRVEHLPAELRESGEPAPAGSSFQQLKAEAERRILLAALERNGWQVTRTAHELGLADHASLLKIMRRHDLRRPPGVS
jgi:DNA-binding NtrC family response regulator